MKSAQSLSAINLILLEKSCAKLQAASLRLREEAIESINALNIFNIAYITKTIPLSMETEI